MTFQMIEIYSSIYPSGQTVNSNSERLFRDLSFILFDAKKQSDRAMPMAGKRSGLHMSPLM